MSVIGFPRVARPAAAVSASAVVPAPQSEPTPSGVLPGSARDLLTGLFEIGGVSLSRLAELQAAALQELAEANRVRVASIRERSDLPALLAAERRFHGAVATQLRHGLLARRDLLRDAARSSAALLRTVVSTGSGSGTGAGPGTRDNDARVGTVRESALD